MKPIPKEKIRNSLFWKPNSSPAFTNNSHSWFDIQSAQRKGIVYKQRTIKGEILRCKKIIIKPNQTQRNILKTWLNIYREVYNLTVKYFKKHKICKKSKARKIIRNKIDNKPYLNGLIKNSKIPLHTVNNAIFDVLKAYKTGFSNLKLRNIKFFRLRYKKAKKSTHILVLEPNVFNSAGTGLNLLILKNLNPSTKIETECDVRLQYNSRTKQFILFVPENREILHKPKRLNRCALDPGMRVFQSVYSDDGAILQIGTEKTNQKIKKLIAKIEYNSPNKEKKWYEKFINRLRTKIKNMITDLHWKVARFLCKMFDNIMIGKMSTKDIIRKHTSVLTPESKRFCVALSHFTFIQRLQTKCEEFAVNYKEVDESYTSKTCGKCGEMRDDLAGAKIFECNQENCSYKMNRDIHGARNILIKHT